MVARLNSAHLATGQVGQALWAEAPGTIHPRGFAIVDGGEETVAEIGG